jgi:hypothetical protein
MATPASETHASTEPEASQNEPDDESLIGLEGFSALSISENTIQHLPSTPKSNTTRKLFLRVCQKIRQKTTSYDRIEAAVYTFGHIDHPKLVKCGYTSRSDPTLRIREQGSRCHYEVELAYHSEPMYCAHRAEQIVHRLLANFGSPRFMCTCGKMHQEWFQAPMYLVITWIDRVTGWIISQKPYDDAGELTEVWRHNLDIFEASLETDSPRQWEEFFIRGRYIHPSEFLTSSNQRPRMPKQTHSDPSNPSLLSTSPSFASPKTPPRRVSNQGFSALQKSPSLFSPDTSSPTPQIVINQEESSSETSDSGDPGGDCALPPNDKHVPESDNSSFSVSSSRSLGDAPAPPGTEAVYNMRQHSKDDEQIDADDEAGDGEETQNEEAKNEDQCGTDVEIESENRPQDSTKDAEDRQANDSEQAEQHEDVRHEHPTTSEPTPNPPPLTRRLTFTWNAQRWARASFNFEFRPRQDLPPPKPQRTFSFRQAASAFPGFTFRGTNIDASPNQSNHLSKVPEPIPAVVQTAWVDWKEELEACLRQIDV